MASAAIPAAVHGTIGEPITGGIVILALPYAAVDAGSLKRAHELEALGFLQLTLAASNKTSWTSRFALAK
jgi:hypothetical protein